MSVTNVEKKSLKKKITEEEQNDRLRKRVDQVFSEKCSWMGNTWIFKDIVETIVQIVEEETSKNRKTKK